MTSALSREQWRRVLEDADPTTYGEVVAVLGDRDLLEDDPAALVDAALDAGDLVEEGEGFGTLRLPDSVDAEAGDDTEDESSEEAVLAAFDDAVGFFADHLDDDISAHTGEDGPETPREYFAERRGWSAETVAEKRLGYAPADDRALRLYLRQRGHDDAAILGTGLFTEDLRPLWQGRYVFPYFDAEGAPVYAISRCLKGEGGGGAAKDYGGHPEDFIAGKYGKCAHTKDYVEVSEPIYGLGTLERDGPVLITEGMADAIQAHQAGYTCLSPVTTQFKNEHRETLLEILRDADRRVYIIQDAERPKAEAADEDEATGWDALGLEQFGEGVKGAVRTAAHLADGGVDAYLAELPRPGLGKVDLDDYLREWGDTLAPVLASAKPADQHRAFGAVVDASTPAPASVAARAGGEWASSGRERDDDAGDRDLSREAVEDALSHVDPMLSYDDWIQLAYAVHDWNAGATGRQVFETWSRASPKWEEKESTAAVEWIWENATPGGKTTVASLIHRAKQGGWTPPASSAGARGATYPVEECAPPLVETTSYDRAEWWGAFQDERYDAALEASGPHIQADDAGTGKTTNAGGAAAKRERRHAVLFQNHAKAREFIRDDATPEGYFHLRGAEQKRDAVCMDADHAGEECPEHGHGSDCPHTCPVYDLPTGHSFKELFRRVAAELNPMQAHIILADRLAEHGHDEDGTCAWTDQFSAAADADRLVGVHEYQTLKTIKGGDRPRDVIVDESPDTLKSDRRLGVESLTRMGNALDAVGDLAGTPDALHEFAAFTRALVDVLADPEAPDGLAALEAPSVEGREVREYPGQEYSEGYRTREVVAEALAEAKFAYHDTLRARIDRDEWDGAPFAFDALLAAAAEAGLDAEAAREAIALPTTLDDCPRCATGLSAADGRRCCGACGWTEGEDFYTSRDGEEARALAWADADPAPGEGRAVVLETLPLVSDLPDDPLILDATATPEKVAAVYGADPAGVEVTGDDHLAIPNLRTTQVLDGQYHAGTIGDALDEGRALADRVQRTIDMAGDVHERPLFILKKGLRERFTFPEGAEVLHYHALRGRNFNDCDAVVCIGAPHPRVDDLRRDAALLAQGRDDVRAGGAARSSNAHEGGEPVYRKLRYEDDDGRGRAVPTKTYTGLTGALFEEGRRKELEQAVHRIRPLPTDEAKHAYLLTNVPTDLPVDEVCSFADLADPVEALLPVPEGALSLAECVRDAAAGDAPDGFRAGRLVERVGGDQRADGGVAFRVAELHRLAGLNGLDVSERTVRRWKDALVDLGLLDAGAYEQRDGVGFHGDAATLTRALSVLPCNAGVEVAVKRRIRRLAEESDGSLAWLATAREAFGLAGDRCTLTPGDPPPG